jgi:hypothetical protein
MAVSSPYALFAGLSIRGVPIQQFPVNGIPYRHGPGELSRGASDPQHIVNRLTVSTRKKLPPSISAINIFVVISQRNILAQLLLFELSNAFLARYGLI